MICGSVAEQRLFEAFACRLEVDAVELQSSAAWGVHCVARRPLRPGDVVLVEAPLLRLPPSDAAELRRFGALAEFLAPALAVKWRETSKEIREACLRLFYAPAERSRGHLEACEELLRSFSALKSTGWSASELLKFLHVVDLNIHKDDERPEHAAHAAIFVFGSKFSHSCAPNSTWSFDSMGRLRYKAIRPIEKGELLSFSYVGNGMNLLTSTSLRRRRLQQLSFLCRCERCEAPDVARRLRCACGGEALSEGDAWRCDRCGPVETKRLPLELEEELSVLVPQVMQSPASRCRQDLQRLAELRRRAQALGPRHWTRFLATFAWLQKCLLCLRTEALIPFTEKELRVASCEVVGWLEQSAPKNVEQRLCALFLSVRLARHFGEALTAWGYDLKDPLKEKGEGLGESVALEKLKLMGWELTESGVAGVGEEIEYEVDLKRLPPPETSRFWSSGWR